ncbi:MAG: BRCT domain-containing protein [Bacillus sp. (in: firmicutes)]
MLDKMQVEGKIFVITGTLSKTRREIAAAITQNGGIMAGAVTSKTDYLVIGRRFGNTKVSAAFKYGTFTITEEELAGMLDAKKS